VIVVAKTLRHLRARSASDEDMLPLPSRELLAHPSLLFRYSRRTLRIDSCGSDA